MYLYYTSKFVTERGLEDNFRTVTKNVTPIIKDKHAPLFSIILQRTYNLPMD